jgi:hypothetical protein
VAALLLDKLLGGAMQLLQTLDLDYFLSVLILNV